MGRLLNTKTTNAIRHNNDIFKDHVEDPILELLDTNATPCTYFNKHRVLTTDDKFFSGQLDSMGKKFDMISDMILYGIDKINMESEVGEFGLNTSYNGTAVMAYNSITPQVYDMFVISYLPNYLFRITDIESPDILSKKFYKISFEFYRDHYDMTRIDIVNKYKFIFDNISNGLNTVVLVSDYDIISKMEHFYEYLRSNYINIFYKNNVNDFIFNNGDIKFNNPLSTMFINQLKLFDSDDSKFIIGDNIDMNNDIGMRNTFRRSIYNAINTRDISLMNTSSELTAINNTFDRSILLSYDINFILYFNEEFNNIFSLTNLYDRLKNVEGSYVLNVWETLILEYFTNDSISIDTIKDIDVQYDINSFIYIPMILGILLKVSNDMMS